MKRWMIAAAAVLALAACKKQEQAAPADTVFTGLTVVDSFKTPESVLYDYASDAYLVSNINGSPFERDDNGFISRINPDGRVDELRWIDGADSAVTLNAPKGMAIKGDTLFVADINEIRLFDRVTGAPLGSRRTIAPFLNDITVGPDGTVYFTDSGFALDFSVGFGLVYRFDRRGRPEFIASPNPDGGEGGPNGIVADSAGLTVVQWDGTVLRIDGRGRITWLPRVSAQLDGLVLLADGSLLVSSWADSTIYRLAPGDTAWVAAHRGIESPADIGLDTRRQRVLIPQFNLNQVRIIPAR